MPVTECSALVLPMRADELVDLAIELERIQKSLGVTKHCTKRDGRERERGVKVSHEIRIRGGNWPWGQGEAYLDAFMLLTVPLRPILTIVARNHVFSRHANMIRDVIQDLDGTIGRFTWLDRGVVRKVEGLEVFVVV